MKTRLTDEQRAVVETLRGDLCVAAGAGSGKTTVLAHRFAEALNGREGWDAAPVDGVLTMTFTNKAAAEIAERVRRVASAGAQSPASQSMDSAWISTIHSFCSRLVRRHALEVGVDPYFALADEMTAQALQTEAFDSVMDGIIRADLHNAARVLEMFGLDGLRMLATKTCDQVRAMGRDPESILVPNDPRELVVLVQVVRDRARDLLAALEESKQTPAVARDRQQLGDYISCLAAWEPTLENGVEQLLALEEGFTVGCRSATELRQALAAARKGLGDAASAVALGEVTSLVERIIREYSVAYERLKKSRGLLDFEDLQETAVRLFESRPDIAERYRAQFKLIMVDEFQDTNRLQMRVVEPLRSGNLCVVGDVRQSIYGWRYADVEIFQQLSTQMDRKELSSNFRSHPAILRFANGLFSQDHLFGPDFMHLKPRESDEEDGVGPLVECLFVRAEGSKRANTRAAEAAWIAEKIDELIRVGHDGGDVAILLRNSTGATEFARALEARGISALVTAGQNLHDSLEATELVALLRSIAVPHDDEALLNVLSGRLVGLSDSALLSIRRAATGALWSGLEALARQGNRKGLHDADVRALVHAYATLDRFNAEQSLRRLPELLAEACEAFDYDLTLHSLGAAGVRAWANVLKLTRQAEAFERAEGNDVAAFAAYLQERGRLSVDTPAAADLGDGAVRIMTVHSSKGLEFPAVFVADLGIDKERPRDTVLIQGEESAGPPLVGLKLPGACGGGRTVQFQSLQPGHRQREVEEQKRVLYVACTRAKERLFISGATNLDEPAEEARGIIDWVREALPFDTNADGADRGVIAWQGTEVGVTVLGVPDQGAPDDFEETPPTTPEPFFADIPSIDDPAPVILQPKTLSFSSLDLFRKCPLSFHARHELGLKTIDIAEQVGATQLGSAAHDALQAVQLGSWDREKAGVIAKRHRLGTEHMRQVSSAVEAFGGSALARRLEHADRVMTECPLLYRLDELVLTGSIDAIAWEGARALVIDYKTGKPPAEAPEREQSHQLQAECYALAAIAAGAEAVEVAFAFVEAEMQLKTYLFDRADRERLHAKLMGIVSDIRADGRPHLAEYDPVLCSACVALGGVCPVSPPVVRGKGPSRGA